MSVGSQQADIADIHTKFEFKPRSVANKKNWT